MFVSQKGIVSDIVGANPDGVNGAGGIPSEKCRAVLRDVFRIGDKRREFVIGDVREGGIDSAEPARGDIVGTDSAADSVVIEGRVAVDGCVAWPDAAAGGSFVALCLVSIGAFKVVVHRLLAVLIF